MDLALLNLTSSMLLLTMNSNSFVTRNRVMTYSHHEEPMKFRFFFSKVTYLWFPAGADTPTVFGFYNSGAEREK